MPTKNTGANYDISQLFLRVPAWLIVAVSGWRLGLHAWHHRTFERDP